MNTILSSGQQSPLRVKEARPITCAIRHQVSSVLKGDNSAEVLRISTCRLSSLKQQLLRPGPSLETTRNNHYRIVRKSALLSNRI